MMPHGRVTPWPGHPHGCACGARAGEEPGPACHPELRLRASLGGGGGERGMWVFQAVHPWALALPSLQAEEVQQQIIRETFHLVLKRDDHICNFLECGR